MGCENVGCKIIGSENSRLHGQLNKVTADLSKRVEAHVSLCVEHEELKQQLAEKDAQLARCVETINMVIKNSEFEMANCEKCGHAESIKDYDCFLFLQDCLDSLPDSAKQEDNDA